MSHFGQWNHLRDFALIMELSYLYICLDYTASYEIPIAIVVVVFKSLLR